MSTFLYIDYPTWWYLVIGALFSGYAILDGFDLGAGAWHLFFKKEESRRIALNAIGPVWDGNEVWLVIGGGALFAGFPVVYATLFSFMYIPFMLFLAALIFRAVSIEFRSKESMRWWRQLWDVCYSVSSILLAFLLGVVLGNVLQGIAIGPDYSFQGHWLQFLNLYAIMVGISTLALCMMHGAIYLTMKTEGRLFARIAVLLRNSIVFFMTAFGLVSLYTLIYLPHLVERLKSHPGYFIFPTLAFFSIAIIPRLVRRHRYRVAFVFSSLTVSLLLALVALGLYPTLLVSTVNPQCNIDIYNGAASDKSLGIMLKFALIGAPLVLSYTIFVFYTFRGKVKLDDSSY